VLCPVSVRHKLSYDKLRRNKENKKVRFFQLNIEANSKNHENVIMLITDKGKGISECTLENRIDQEKKNGNSNEKRRKYL